MQRYEELSYEELTDLARARIERLRLIRFSYSGPDGEADLEALRSIIKAAQFKRNAGHQE